MARDTPTPHFEFSFTYPLQSLLLSTFPTLYLLQLSPCLTVSKYGLQGTDFAAGCLAPADCALRQGVLRAVVNFRQSLGPSEDVIFNCSEFEHQRRFCSLVRRITHFKTLVAFNISSIVQPGPPGTTSLQTSSRTVSSSPSRLQFGLCSAFNHLKSSTWFQRSSD